MDWLKRRTITVFGLLIFVYLLLGSGKLIYENYRVHQDEKILAHEVDELEQRNLELKSLLAYYRTDSYKEKEARARLGYQQPGERVVVVPRPKNEELVSITQPGERAQPATPPSNPEQWLEYFFGKG
ncbi:MAG: septum formation initiator family protein [Patescibacteria group bacterium]|nr:septum formation initiator family protein [Patescibacteria group bacterium]